MSEPVPVKLCKRGHERTPENTDARGCCRICARELAKIRYAKNPEAKLSQTKQWSAKNREKINAYNANWRQKNINKSRAAQARYRKNNPEKIKAARDNCKALNPEKHFESQLKSRLKYADRNKPRNAEKAREARSSDPEGYREKCRAWYKNNIDHYRARGRKAASVRIGEITDSYVASKMEIPVKELHPGIIELKRMMIQLHRAKRAYLKGELKNEQTCQAQKSC